MGPAPPADASRSGLPPQPSRGNRRPYHGAGRPPGAGSGPLATPALMALVVLAASCGTTREADGPAAPDEMPQLTADLAALKSWFARTAGHPRAVALLSPT